MKDYFRPDLAGKQPSEINVPVRKHMLCLNESCLDPYQAIKADFLQRMESIRLNRYLSPVTEELHTRLAAYAGLDKARIVWGNGADDLLYHIFLAVRWDDNAFAVSLAPSYFDYKTFCGMVGLKIRFVDLQEDLSFDTREYLRLASDPDCRLAILCNPNNPTGNLFSPEQLSLIVETLPDKLVLIDETYHEFSGATFASELDLHPNLILIRSFSKAFSGAGLRFGYALSREENIHSLRKVLTTFHTSILNQAFALTILENSTLFQAHVRDVISMRDSMQGRLQELPGVRVFPSHTNFLTFSVGDDTAALFEHLKDHEVAVRDVRAHPLLRDCLRLTIGCEEDNRAFMSALETFLTNRQQA
ncbi:MAG: aminotransferase class I/II-fold pyridoxal phosphate-dependent enzyme [Candidatus Syntrophosphaera sp.]|nr:aminotransferase class I/II-fold pyridoxal phosphate-dependent enzyme [Candidatus Syntrophosphaera sp.]